MVTRSNQETQRLVGHWGEGKGVSKYPAWENGCTILPSAKTENAGGETGQDGEGKGLS